MVWSARAPANGFSRDLVYEPEALTRARLAAIVASCPDAIIGETLDGVITDWNPAAKRLYGYSPGEAIGQSLAILTPPDRAHEVADMLARVGAGETIEGFETVRQAKDGRQIAVSLNVFPVRDDNGQIIAASSTSRDITTHAQLTQALHASEAKYRALVEHLPGVVYLLAADARETPLYYSPYLEVLAGIHPDEALRVARNWVELVHPDDRARIAALNVGTIDNGDRFQAEYRTQRTDGSYVWVRDDCVPIRDETEAIVAYQGVLLDIGDRKRAEAALQDALAEAEAATRAKGQFLAMMGHELRTPLQAVLGYADFLLGDVGGPLTAAQREDIGVIHRSAGRMAALIEQVLDLSRLDAGRLELAAEPVDVGQVIEQVSQDVAPQATAKGLRLLTRVPARLPMLVGDEVRVRQIVLNLAGNAVKFTERGEVEIRVCAQDDGIAVTVRDTGIGIAADELPTIFEEFRQARITRSNRYGGAGLGLAISRRLAEEMGGRITVTSALGAGSTFTLWLPVAPVLP